ncbi:hypothetical protein F01_490177 [Burkholderia cenocepacia]|nr:hypothetical protein F01_490177 [Burkholderia cenocepacia]
MLPAKSATLDVNVDHHCLCGALCSRYAGMSMAITIVFFNRRDRQQSGRDRWAYPDSRLPRTEARSSRPPNGCSACAAWTPWG